MKKCILGKKLGMTQVFAENGAVIPVTVIETGACTVVQKKTIESDGYSAIKVGYSEVKERSLNKPQRGIFAKAGVAPMKFLREFRLDDGQVESYEIGQVINASDVFAQGDKVDISGISKGKGFQGTIKRYGQSGGNETHGSMYHRRVGSMGSNTTPARVFKGKKLPGHMGVDKVTIQNLEVIKVDNEKNVMLVKGAVPGPKNALLVIRNSVKAAAKKASKK